MDSDLEHVQGTLVSMCCEWRHGCIQVAVERRLEIEELQLRVRVERVRCGRLTNPTDSALACGALRLADQLALTSGAFAKSHLSSSMACMRATSSFLTLR